MKGKPIEPGCLAIIVGSKHNPENNGRVVRVIRRAGFGEPPPEALAKAKHLRMKINVNPAYDYSVARWWVAPVNGALLWRSGRNILTVECAARSYQEKYLKRIDDGEDHSIDTPASKTRDLDEVI